jgi:hypothetical protein
MKLLQAEEQSQLCQHGVTTGSTSKGMQARVCRCGCIRCYCFAQRKS